MTLELDGREATGRRVRVDRLDAGFLELVGRQYTEDGLSISQLAERYGCTLGTAYYWLKKAGVARRPPKHPPSREVLDQIIDEYQRGASRKRLAARFRTTERTIADELHRRGYAVRKRRYGELAVDGFRDPAEDWHAYYIGYFLGHGTFGTGRHHRSTFQLAIRREDRAVLDSLRIGLGIDNPIVDLPRRAGHVPQSRLVVGSQRLYEALSPWGVGADTSRIIRLPHHIPTRWVPSMIRGYVDAHGSFSRGPHRGSFTRTVKITAGNAGILGDVRGVLEDAGIEATDVRRATSGAAHTLAVRVRQDNLERLLAYLYDPPASIWCPRVYERAMFTTYGGHGARDSVDRRSVPRPGTASTVGAGHDARR